MRTTVPSSFLLSLLLLAPLAARADGETEITAVSATVYNGYERTKLPDGTFRPEHYVFGDGGLAVAAGKDASVDELPLSEYSAQVAIAEYMYLHRTKEEQENDPSPEKIDGNTIIRWWLSKNLAIAFGEYLESHPGETIHLKDEDDLKKISKEFRDFIKAILKKNPKERLACKELLGLDFIRKYRELETC